MGNHDRIWTFAGGIAISTSILIAMRMLTTTLQQTRERTLANAERTMFYGAKTYLYPTFKGIEWSMEPVSKEYKEWKKEQEAGLQVEHGKVHRRVRHTKRRVAK